MSEDADLNDLTFLKARLAAALDRIATRVHEHPSPAPSDIEDPNVTSAALEDAHARAASAEARADELRKNVTDLEAQLKNARQNLNAPPLPIFQDQDAGDVTINKNIESWATGTGDAQEEFTLTDVQDRLARLRVRHTTALEAQDEILTLIGAGGRAEDDPETRILTLRAEAARLRADHAALLVQIEETRLSDEINLSDFSTILLDEIIALRAARAFEAVELNRISGEMNPMVFEEKPNA